MDIERIQMQLNCYDEHIKYIEAIKGDTIVEKLAFERCLNIMIESFLDVGNGMIDGFIMRDPGSYVDIVDILVDERVISEKSGEVLKDFIELRKFIVQQYWDVDYEKLCSTYERCKNEITAFPESVKQYIENELGEVVTAFKA